MSGSEGLGVGRKTAFRHKTNGRRKQGRTHSGESAVTAVDTCATRSLVRPTVGGVIVLLLAGLAWYMALLLDQRSLAAGAVTLTALWLASFLGTAAQCVWPDSVIGPTNPVYEPQFEQLDADGNVIGRYRGGVPVERGWYRRARTIMRWHGPFGLFAARRTLAESGGIAVLQDMPGGGQGLQHLTRPSSRVGLDEPTGMVRPYRPGDSPRLISWKHVAVHNQLMTRDTSDTRKTNVILVLDPVLCGGSTGLDAQAAQVRAWLAAAPNDTRLIVTDGVRVASDPAAATRLLASLRRVGGAEDSTTRRRARHRRNSNGDETHSLTDQDASQWSAASRVKAIDDLADCVESNAGIILLTADAQSDFAKGLCAAFGGRVACVTPAAPADAPFLASRFDYEPKVGRLSEEITMDALSSLAATDTRPARAVPAMLVARPSGAAGDPEDEKGEGIAGNVLTPHSTDALRAKAPSARAGSIATSICMAACSVLFIVGLLHIVQSGVWTFLAVVLLVFASALPIICDVLGRGRGDWLATSILGLLIVGLLVISVATYQYAGVAPWDFSRARRVLSMGVQLNDGTHIAMSIPRDWRMVFSPIFLVFMEIEQGIDSMYYQLPPIRVNPAADVALVALSLVVGILGCLAAYGRRSCAVFGLFPLLSFGAAEALVGATIPVWQLAAAIVAGVSLMWAVTIRDIRPVPAASLVALVTAASLAITPSALQLCYRVELSLGNDQGLFSSSMINPMLDLTRSLRRGDTTTVALTYEADLPLYLRMATMGDFDGDTWNFDKDFAQDGRFYGSGVTLGDDDSNHMSTEERFSADPTPIAMYWYTAYMLNQSGSGIRISTREISNYYQQADVLIDQLRSRFLPIVGTYYVSRTTGEGWLTYSDNTAYSRTDTTHHGMNYRTQGAYITPISSTDFSTIQPIIDIHDQLQALSGDEGDWETRRAARMELVESGDAAVADDHWIVITPTADEDDQTIRDASGDVIGTFEPSEQIQPDMSSSWVSPLFWDPTDEFLQKIGFGEDETYACICLTGGDSAPVSVAFMLDDPHSAYPAEVPANAYDNPQRYSDDTRPDSLLYSTDAPTNEAFVGLGNDLDIDFMFPVDGGHSEASGTVRTLMSSMDEAAEDVRGLYLSLPDSLPDSVTGIVSGAQSAGIDVSGSTRDAQLAAMGYLVDYFTNPDNGFTYSLNVNDNGGRNNLEALDTFLDTRTGYCQHYATALAILGRAMGVPTRVVIGFAAPLGEKTSQHAERSVTMNQLHAWTEAYIDDVGWVPFDVTPGQGSEAAEQPDSGADDGDAADATALPSIAVDTPRPTQTDSDPSTEATDEPAPEVTTFVEPDAVDTDTESPSQALPDSPVDGSLAVGGEFDGPSTALMIALFDILILLLMLWPAIVRDGRQQRRMRLIARGGSGGPDAAGAAWRAAWSEIRDTACDAGVSWNASDTDDDIARAVADAWRNRARQDGAPTTEPDVDEVCAQAQAAQYGGTARRPSGLAALVAQIRGTLRPRPWRLLWPRSVFHHQ